MRTLFVVADSLIWSDNTDCFDSTDSQAFKTKRKEMSWTAYFDSFASWAWIDSQAINEDSLSLILLIEWTVHT